MMTRRADHDEETADRAALALLPLDALLTGTEDNGADTAQVDEANAHAFHQLVAAARRVALPGFDTHGTFKATVYTVDYRRLWRNPFSPRTYSPEAIREMAASLTEHGGVITPLVVAPLRDPRPPAEGGTGGDLLILDGERRYIAAPTLPWPLEELDVLIRPVPTLYHAMLETATVQVAQRVPSEREAGIMCRRLVLVHRALVRRGVTLPDLRQEDLGRLLGRDQSTISRMMALGALDDAVQLKIDRGAISETQARELVGLSPVDARAVAAELEAENAARGEPLAKWETRERVIERKQRTGRVPDPAVLLFGDADAADRFPRLADLWCADLAGLPLPVASAFAAHDLRDLLVAAEEALPKGRRSDPAVRALLRALEHPTIARFVAQFTDAEHRETLTRAQYQTPR